MLFQNSILVFSYEELINDFNIVFRKSTFLHTKNLQIFYYVTSRHIVYNFNIKLSFLVKTSETCKFCIYVSERVI